MTKEKALAVANLTLVVKQTGLSYNVGFKPKPCKSYAIRPDYASACEVRAALVNQLSTFVERWDLIQGGKAA